MPDELIPADIREFIGNCIDSIAQLEALFLLRRESDAAWNSAMIAERLYIREPEAANVLARLCAVDLVVCNDGIYRFAPQPEERGEVVARLADLYARHLIPVTELVHNKAPRIRAFADAFKLRKDE